MGELGETRSSSRMAKSGSGVKKASSGSTKGTKGKSGKTPPASDIRLSDPKVQGAILVALLAVLAVALWYGFTHGCLGRRARRRRTSCCSQ